MIMYDFILLNL